MDHLSIELRSTVSLLGNNVLVVILKFFSAVESNKTLFH